MTEPVSNGIPCAGLPCLVTGGGGRVGGRLVAELCARGARVVTVDRDTARLKDIRRLYPDRLHVVEGPFRAVRGEVAAAVATLDRPPVLFHLAALASASFCATHPADALAGNVDLTRDVLLYAAEAGVPRVVFASSGTLYGDQFSRPATETDLVLAANLYTATKLAGEMLVAADAAARNTVAFQARIANVYMKDPPPDTAVHKVLSTVASRRPARMFSLFPVRDFIYIDDVVEGLIRLALAAADPGWQAVNVATGVGTSIAGFARLACETARVAPELVTGPEPGPDDYSYNVLAPDRLLALTGWKPATGLAKGLSRILGGVLPEA